MNLKDIIHWIVENNEDTEAMNKINKTTFPFTSKYLKYQEDKEDEPNF